MCHESAGAKDCEDASTKSRKRGIQAAFRQRQKVNAAPLDFLSMVSASACLRGVMQQQNVFTCAARGFEALLWQACNLGPVPCPKPALETLHQYSAGEGQGS